MDVINFSGGGPAVRAAERRADRGGGQRRRRRRRARHRGGQRPRRLRLRHGRLAEHGAATRSPSPPSRTRRSSRPRSARSTARAPRCCTCRSRPAARRRPAWASANQTLVDIGSIVGRNGQPVERHLCGSAADPNGADNPLPANSLTGAIALVSRGTCSFASKAGRAQAAGAIGIVVVDNRFGEANGIPVQLQIPAGMIADVDGAALRAAMGSAGRIQIRDRPRIRGHRDRTQRHRDELLGRRADGVRAPAEARPRRSRRADPLVDADRSSPARRSPCSTARAWRRRTSTGAAALLVQQHPTWSPQQVKSALMSTAGAAWGNTERTSEAAVTLEGAGLINVARANDPQIFTDPASVSLGDLNVTNGAVSRSSILQVTDAGDGAGTWTVTPAAADGDRAGRRSPCRRSRRSRPAARSTCPSPRTLRPAPRPATTWASSC